MYYHPCFIEQRMEVENLNVLSGSNTVQTGDSNTSLILKPKAPCLFRHRWGNASGSQWLTFRKARKKNKIGNICVRRF